MISPWANRFLLLAVLSALLCVLIGAFGAHALKAVLNETSRHTYQTAVEYQMFHSLALLWLASYWQQSVDVAHQKVWMIASSLMAMGIVFFSGSLYVLAITQINWWGAVTPIGGVCFILAWLLLLVAVFRQKLRSNGRSHEDGD